MGIPEILPNEKQARRFWRRFKKNENGCWEWQGWVNSVGYGVYDWSVNYKKYKMTAHRLSMLLAYGYIPEGKCVLHHCDNRLCMNPGHLFYGTQAENMQDCIKKGRRNNTHHPNIRWMTDGLVRIIREKHADGMSGKELAEIFSLSQSTISEIVNRKTWAHVLPGHG